MGLYDDWLSTGPFEVLEERSGRRGKKHMIKRDMTIEELKVLNEELLDTISEYAELVEYFVNETGTTVEDAKKKIHQRQKPE